MNSRPTVDRPAPSVSLTAEGRRLLQERVRLLDGAVKESRAVLDDPERSAESVEAHQRVTRELESLRAILRAAESVEQCPDDPSTVELGDPVTIQLESGELETYIVVHAAEAPVEDRRISVESPLGAALIGRQVGDRVEVRVPGGSYSCTILSAQRGEPSGSSWPLSGGHDDAHRLTR